MNITVALSPSSESTSTLLVAYIFEGDTAQSLASLSAHSSKVQISGQIRTEKEKKTLFSWDKGIGLFFGTGATYSLEVVRRVTHKSIRFAQEHGYDSLALCLPSFTDLQRQEEVVQAIGEVFILSTYRYEKYKKVEGGGLLKDFRLLGEGEALSAALLTGVTIGRATCLARTLINDPVISLTAVALSERIIESCQPLGVEVEVFHEAKIRAMKMEGVLAVNAGSLDPPTFSILTYKPKHAVNAKPVILVGKGVVYDTGGLSLKPTVSMNFMKSDMGGAAAVIGAIQGIASLNLPYYVMGLIPSTDNRPGVRAITPGDVIEYSDGTTVEVLNTDAEGRLILADALLHAKRYDPDLVIDLATLTGAAVMAIGRTGLALMAKSADADKELLKVAGNHVYERLVEFPLWDEYGDMLKSDIADIKNIGGRFAGAITAGKFLEHFTDYPWIHLDIAGSVWFPSADSYRGKSGTGVGVRLLIDFIRRRCTQHASA